MGRGKRLCAASREARASASCSGRMIEDRRAVLRTVVRPLTIQRGGIVVIPEDIEQIGKLMTCGIEGYFDHFGVPGAVRAHVAR